ncbi:MAG: hypothetical protein ACTSRP_27725 [Candidatus Helarchaeota archaeon]
MTDPRLIDTNNDGASDWEQFGLGAFTDNDGDGLSNYEETAGYYVTFPNGTSYLTTSDPEKADTDGDGLNDYEERYFGKDNRITDARKNDTDGDFLIDSAESFSITIGRENRTKVSKNSWNSFEFESYIQSEIDTNGESNSVGVVRNATLTIGLSTANDHKYILIIN